MENIKKKKFKYSTFKKLYWNIKSIIKSKLLCQSDIVRQYAKKQRFVKQPLKLETFINLILNNQIIDNNGEQRFWHGDNIFENKTYRKNTLKWYRQWKCFLDTKTQKIYYPENLI